MNSIKLMMSIMQAGGLCLLLLVMAACGENSQPQQLSSPGEIHSIEFLLSDEGQASYLVKRGNKLVIDSSSLGFEFVNQPPLRSNLQIISSSTRTVEDRWEMPWGEQREVINHYNAMTIELQETVTPHHRINLHFRAYDDGIGFRYEFLPREGIDSLAIRDEHTQFQLTGDHTAWWIPGDWDIYEHLYSTTRISEIDALAYRDHPDLAQSYIPEYAVSTPLTMRTSKGLHMSIHEANLTNYAGMTLKVDNQSHTLTTGLVGSDRREYKVKRALPFKTPWRTIQIADKATELIESKLIVNLNEPNKIGDVSWFDPQKYMGIWWEMHIDTSTWDYGLSRDMNGNWVDTGNAHGRHGATTENARRYIDFAAEHGIKGVLVEGWNTGWEHWFGVDDREGVFDFVTSYPDYDLEEIANYANEKGVQLIMHHETSAAPRAYEQQLDTAYSLMKDLGMHLVKTGYVGNIIPEGEYHHGQWMVNHYRRVLETAAEYEVAVNAHEPIKATGLRRTYPNAVSREGLRGQEFNAWASDGGNPPEHLPIVAFTRMLAGPIDYTPGVFEIFIPSKEDNRVNTTLAHQLALYVVIYSPVQMASDLPENYENQPAFQFIREVGVNWERTEVLNGEVGEYVTIARKERDTGNWFLGSITDENERKITVDFDFLDRDKTYRATIYRDGNKAHYKTNPLALDIIREEITRETLKTFRLAEGGGIAISLVPVSE